MTISKINNLGTSGHSANQQNGGMNQKQDLQKQNLFSSKANEMKGDQNTAAKKGCPPKAACPPKKGYPPKAACPPKKGCPPKAACPPKKACPPKTSCPPKTGATTPSKVHTTAIQQRHTPQIAICPSASGHGSTQAISSGQSSGANADIQFS